MVTLTNTDAVTLVRKNLDELDTNSSQMVEDNYEDNKNLDNIIRRNLPEAVNAVVLAAPSALLEGKTATSSDMDSVSATTDGVLSFELKSTTKFLRLVAFRAADSDIVVTDAIPEASPEGRKQLNGYVRGRYDRPRLVQGQGFHTGPAFRYYTLRNDYSETPSGAIDLFVYAEESTPEFYRPHFPDVRRARAEAILFYNGVA